MFKSEPIELFPIRCSFQVGEGANVMKLFLSVIDPKKFYNIEPWSSPLVTLYKNCSKFP
jgi:hypothetical protein